MKYQWNAPVECRKIKFDALRFSKRPKFAKQNKAAQSLRISEVRMAGRTLTCLVFAAAAVTARPALGTEPQWPAAPYKYLVIDQDIKGVMAEFGRNIGLPVDVSDQVKGRLRGQLAPATATAREFLGNLCESYGLVWYYDGAVLHINTKSEIRTELINIGRLSPGEVGEKLSALGVADTRFQVRSTEDAGVISVSGPPPFVSMVRQTLAILLRRPPPVQEDTHGDEIKVRVFRGSTMSTPSETVTSRAKS
jgi:type II secretory pathway component GspD/PulD (secretin)